MAITQTKKNFIKKISGGLHVLMATTYSADEIAINQCNETEEYIAKHLLYYEKSAIGVTRAWFSEKKFYTFIDTEDDKTIADVLYHLDNIDMCAREVFEEACIDPGDLTEDEKNFVERMKNDDFSSFHGLIEY